MINATRFVRAPKEIQNRATGEILKLYGLELGLEPKAIYENPDGSTLPIDPARVEREFVYARTAPRNLVSQGKFECGAAALATLTGHTLFTVKRVMGDFGWSNDHRGVSDRVARETARALGHDLLFCGKRSVVTILHEMPPALITLRSLNYPKAFHGVAWYDGQIVDPNYGHA